MSSENKPLTPNELQAFERQRDFGQELLGAVLEMQAGLGKVVYSNVSAVRKSHGLTQRALAELFGVPVSHVEAWERCEAAPSASESLLLQLALEYPEIFRSITKLDIAR